jgi:MFS family permease
VGGEFGGATSLLAEFGAKRRSRAFWMSLANLGLALGIMAASGMFLLLRNSFATTGWRVAMLSSAIIVIPALVARYKLADSPLFEQLKRKEKLARLPSFDVFRKHAGSILLLATVAAFQNLDTVVTGTYIVSFMHLASENFLCIHHLELAELQSWRLDDNHRVSLSTTDNTSIDSWRKQAIALIEGSERYGDFSSTILLRS